jgi:LCP family protein required for cell wall assembly
VYAVKRRAGRKWKRVVLLAVLGVFVVMAAAAGGYYLWIDAQVSAANRRVPEEVREVLAEKPSTTITARPVSSTSTTSPASTTTTSTVESPSAMNVLILGSDRRSATSKVNGLSDTIILVHVDPDNDYLSLLSFPRDLRVEVAGHGTQKLNAAYSYGGAALAIPTVEQLTGVDINHYLELDFKAFRDITDSLGGVYVEVDRRYYYDGALYEKISLQPGYQLLDGDDALDYVRFRHDGNLDFGRMERQQRFLGAVRQQAMGWDLAFTLPGLISAFFANVTTDLETNDFVKLAWWGVGLDGERIRQVSLIGKTATIAEASYVIADQDTIAAAVQEFLTVPAAGEATSTAAAAGSSTTTTTAVATLSGVEVDVLNASAGTGMATATGSWLSSLGATVVTVGNAGEAAAATLVRYPSGMSLTATQVASVVGAASVTETASVARITVILGSDFALPAEYAALPNPSTIPSSAVWKALARKVSFAVEAPAYLPSGCTMSKRTDNNATVYKIKAGDDEWPTFVMLYKARVSGASADQYMNITETTWLDAPAASVGREVLHDGTVLTVVGSSGKVERVWWKTGGVLYWVANTLSHLLSEEDLVAVAQSMISIPAQ